MKEQIKEQIINSKVTSFQHLFEHNKENITKSELNSILGELEKEKAIVSAFNKVFSTQDLIKKEGFTQWSINGLCWIAPENESNSWGLNFKIPDEIISIFNKKSTPLNSYCRGVLLEDNEKIYFFAQEILEQKPYKVIYWVAPDNQCYQLNNAIKTKLNFQDADTGSIKTALMQNGAIKDVEAIGTLEERGIESKIVSLLGELSEAPENDSPEDFMPLDYKDYTKEKFFTIDGKYTKDIDDAICFKKTKTGYTLLVAIADVSHYVLEGTEQDKHAQEVATSFYFPHKVVHMLCRSLAEKNCSLNPGDIKRTMICKIKFDLDGNGKTYKFMPALIRSHARLTYDDVNLMLDNKEPLESIFYEDKKHFQKIKTSLQSLNLFRTLKPLSGNKSSWNYSKPDYVLNEQGKIDHLIDSPSPTPSEQMVEFSMLHANICAAQELFNHYPEIGLFRNQQAPQDIQKPKAATYASNNDGHWGVGSDFYTHFTSPIRRYCDLIVHRLLKEIIKGKKRSHEVVKLSNIANVINSQQSKAKQLDLRTHNLLLQQYTQELFDKGVLGKTMTILDIVENGLIARNKQKISYFIPNFKLSREISDLIEQEESKENSLEIIKNNYKILGFVDYYQWVEDKKNVSYLMKPHVKKELKTTTSPRI